MRSLADVKRRATPGAWLTLIYSKNPDPYLDVPRMIVHVRRNAVQLAGGTWIDWPEDASKVEFGDADPNVFVINGEIAYRFGRRW